MWKIVPTADSLRTGEEYRLAPTERWPGEPSKKAYTGAIAILAEKENGWLTFNGSQNLGAEGEFFLLIEEYGIVFFLEEKRCNKSKGL